ncbi:MAG: DUF5683 domain-containing protein [Fibrobacteria bacterium]
MKKAAPDSVKTTRLDSAKAMATPADSTKAAAMATDSAKTKSDSAQASGSGAPAAAAIDSTGDGDSTQAKAKAKKRKRVVRETTVNTIDELKGKYRSPKRALFMSMVVPGLGQAYVGQHWSNYARGTAYFLADVALIVGWHHYVVDRQDAQIKKYQAFADENWRQSRYEDSLRVDLTKLDTRNQHRESYCDAVQENSSASGQILHKSCLEPKAEGDVFQSEYDDQSWAGVDSIAHRRGQFPNSHEFYELIGKQEEFITGWSDANNVYMGDSAFYVMAADGSALRDGNGNPVAAFTDMQQDYIGMRAKANDYARMQAYFLGGMVVNHIVSAIDAALAAHYHNKALYQTDTRWYDRLRMDSRLAWDGYAPVPTVTASFTF